ncbi:right-handed parallel beta-helix repeat-containing protein [Streptococcus dentapri]|uniref:Right-handed parallel beta-helix repeat-containing protein n=1 Tax=Streptococcus dentapri TaxID=573564 RepID=A0ABV8D2F8_9STRE
MILKKQTITLLMGLFALGIGWQTTTVSADEMVDNSVAASGLQSEAHATVGVVNDNETTSSQVEDSQSVNSINDGASAPYTAYGAETTVPEDGSTDNSVTTASQSEIRATAGTVNDSGTAQTQTGNGQSTQGYGADLPYTTYEAETAAVANGAVIQHSLDIESTAIEASNQKYVELPEQGSSVSFKVKNPANAINVRYTIPDGESGQLDVQVNGNSIAKLDLSSKSAWQYLDGDVANDSPSPNSRVRFRFDETHTLLNSIQLQSGDTITLIKNNADKVVYGIDFIELEQVGNPIAESTNAINITSKGAVANDNIDDSQALIDAINEANATGKNVYIPEGRFNLDRKIGVDASNIKISGAGMWYTHLHFTSDQRAGGGFEFNHNDNNIEFSDLFMDSNLTSRYHEDAQYKAIAGSLGSNSSIHDIWEQHFEVGMWIGDYDQTGNLKYTDGLVIKNARIRNNLADGVNFAQGTKNSTVINSSVRGNGDDGLATWSSISYGTQPTATENNKFLNNTIELGWRAAGVGIFGGKGHEVANNLIKDNFAGAGVRVSTVFAGHNYDNNDTGITIHDNYLLRSGTQSDLYNKQRGAIDFETNYGDIKNVSVSDNKILNSITQPFKAENFTLSDTGNDDIYISNNTIDEAAPVEGEEPVNQTSDEISAAQPDLQAIPEETPADGSDTDSDSDEPAVSETPAAQPSAEVSPSAGEAPTDQTSDEASAAQPDLQAIPEETPADGSDIDSDEPAVSETPAVQPSAEGSPSAGEIPADQTSDEISAAQPDLQAIPEETPADGSDTDSDSDSDEPAVSETPAAQPSAEVSPSAGEAPTDQTSDEASAAQPDLQAIPEETPADGSDIDSDEPAVSETPAAQPSAEVSPSEGSAAGEVPALGVSPEKSAVSSNDLHNDPMLAAGFGQPASPKVKKSVSAKGVDDPASPMADSSKVLPNTGDKIGVFLIIGLVLVGFTALLIRDKRKD